MAVSRGRDPGQAGKVETRVVDSLAISFRLLLLAPSVLSPVVAELRLFTHTHCSLGCLQLSRHSGPVPFVASHWPFTSPGFSFKLWAPGPPTLTSPTPNHCLTGICISFQGCFLVLI